MSPGTRLPVVDTEEAFDGICGDEAALRPGVERLCRALGVDPARLERLAGGSLPVYAAGRLVLKLFPQVCAADHAVEAGVMDAVHGRLPIPTPALQACGLHDGWGYVLMDRLGGDSLDRVWPRLRQADRDGLADTLGEALAALHALPSPPIEGWQPTNWDAFVGHQRATAVDRHRAKGLDEDWLAQVPAFLDRVDLRDGAPVLLHTEVMRQHLLVGQHPAGGWHFTGLFDFEPSMRGAREYEFVALAAFVAEGDARFLGRTLRAYGYAPSELDGALRRRLMAWTLLHVYGNPAGYLRRLPAPVEPTLESLADSWFTTGS